MNRQPKRFNKKVVLIITAIGLCLLIGLFIARGPLINWYVESVYLPKIERSFEQDFKEIDPKLAALGLTFEKPRSRHLNRPANCDNAMYEGISLSKFCYILYLNDNPAPEITDAYRELWRTKSPALEEYVLANGWTKTGNTQQPINELLIRGDGNENVGARYEKHHGKITCKLAIWYDGSVENPDDRKLNAQKSCTRTIEFFGGY